MDRYIVHLHVQMYHALLTRSTSAFGRTDALKITQRCAICENSGQTVGISAHAKGGMPHQTSTARKMEVVRTRKRRSLRVMDAKTMKLNGWF